MILAFSASNSASVSAPDSWLLEHDDLPSDPLVVQVPVSVRTDEEMGTYGNRIMLMSAPFFTNEPNAERRLEKTHRALAAMKEHHRALPAELLQDTNHFIPPAVFDEGRASDLRDIDQWAGPADLEPSSPTCPARSSRSTARAPDWSGTIPSR